MISNFSSIIGAAALVAAVFIGAPRIHSQEIPGAVEAFATFQRQVADYVELRHDAVQGIPGLKVGDPRSVSKNAGMLRAAIAGARRDAEAGDIFVPATQPVFRQLLAQTLREHRINLALLLLDLEEDVPPGAPRAAVNERYFWGWGAAIPPCLLSALPPLPRELQYRFAGRDLVLIDLDTELVLDVLPEALPGVD